MSCDLSDNVYFASDSEEDGCKQVKSSQVNVDGKDEKRDKKADKKHRRCQHNFERQANVKCSSNPTKIIGICNAGLSNGLSEDVLTQQFSKYGPIIHVLGVPGKSFSFIEFSLLEDAKTAFESINGKLNIAQGNKPLYLTYLTSISDEYKSNKFNEEVALPNGLILLNDFVNENEEKMLLTNPKFVFDDNLSSALKQRQVKHFGYEFRYDINNVKKDEPMNEGIPNELDYLWERLKNEKGCLFIPDQLTINYYKPGDGIPAHVDTHSAFEDPLICLSLGSGIIMEFNNTEGEIRPVYLPRRSLMIMSGESRYAWTHKITARKLDSIPSKNGLVVIPRQTRISFTFRKINKKNVCDCIYSKLCDSKQQQKCEQGKFAYKLEETHVHEVYNKIATHFSDTRHKPWPNVYNFVTSFETGSFLLDVGCGNGKYLNCNTGIFNLGCDTSIGLLEVCLSRGFQVFSCNCLQIPIRDYLIDCVICIAVIHHLSTEERRLASIKEIARVLRIGGKALIYVWAKDQCKNDEKSTYIKQDRKNRKSNVQVEVLPEQCEEVNVCGISLPVHINRKQFKQQDMLVPWKNKSKDNTQNTFLRYYHVFEEGELENLCQQVPNVKCINSYYDQGNWCIIIEKIK